MKKAILDITNNIVYIFLASTDRFSLEYPRERDLFQAEAVSRGSIILNDFLLTDSDHDEHQSGRDSFPVLLNFGMFPPELVRLRPGVVAGVVLDE